MPPVLVDADELLMNGTEQPLFTPASQIGLEYYSTNLFFDELISNDEIIIRVYGLDDFAGIEKKYRTVMIKGAQKDTFTIINPILVSTYRVTCQQVSGINKTITWGLFTS